MPRSQAASQPVINHVAALSLVLPLVVRLKHRSCVSARRLARPSVDRPMRWLGRPSTVCPSDCPPSTSLHTSMHWRRPSSSSFVGVVGVVAMVPAGFHAYVSGAGDPPPVSKRKDRSCIADATAHVHRPRVGRESSEREIHCPSQPFTIGQPLQDWPRRVAVVAYGGQADYSQLPLVMSNRAAGPQECMQVAHPSDLRQWANGNMVRS